jgi:hypothetical protein
MDRGADARRPSVAHRITGARPAAPNTALSPNVTEHPFTPAGNNELARSLYLAIRDHTIRLPDTPPAHRRTPPHPAPREPARGRTASRERRRGGARQGCGWRWCHPRPGDNHPAVGSQAGPERRKLDPGTRASSANDGRGATGRRRQPAGGGRQRSGGRSRLDPRSGRRRRAVGTRCSPGEVVGWVRRRRDVRGESRRARRPPR